jgi:hypothetical protein
VDSPGDDKQMNAAKAYFSELDLGRIPDALFEPDSEFYFLSRSGSLAKISHLETSGFHSFHLQIHLPAIKSGIG